MSPCGIRIGHWLGKQKGLNSHTSLWVCSTHSVCVCISYTFTAWENNDFLNVGNNWMVPEGRFQSCSDYEKLTLDLIQKTTGWTSVITVSGLCTKKQGCSREQRTSYWWIFIYLQIKANHLVLLHQWPNCTSPPEPHMTLESKQGKTISSAAVN